MTKYTVQYNINQAKLGDANKTGNQAKINKVIIPICVTDRKFDDKKQYAIETAIFAALALDINKHINNKQVTVVSCDTLQRHNDLIAGYLELRKTHGLSEEQLQEKPWLNEQAQSQAYAKTKQRGIEWREANTGIISSLTGYDGEKPLGVANLAWDVLTGQDRVIKEALADNEANLKNIVNKLAKKQANKILSEDPVIKKNIDLFNSCLAEVTSRIEDYLIEEAAKIYDWLDKYNTLFYPVKDNQLKELFNALKTLADNRGVKVTLRLIDYTPIDEEKKQASMVGRSAKTGIKASSIGEHSSIDNHDYSPTIFGANKRKTMSPSNSPHGSPSKNSKLRRFGSKPNMSSRSLDFPSEQAELPNGKITYTEQTVEYVQNVMPTLPEPVQRMLRNMIVASVSSFGTTYRGEADEEAYGLEEEDLDFPAYR